MPTIKPMLAAKLEDIGLDKLKYPLLASPKLDGVRALVVDGVVMSRSMKPIPNKHVQALFGRPELNGFDGELCVGPATAKDLMQRTMSGVMSEDGEPDVAYHVFDRWDRGGWAYDETLTHLGHLESRVATPAPWAVVDTYPVESEAELLAYEAECLHLGYEGVMVRDPQGLYKQGRCGVKTPWLVKVKRFEDAEAVVVGVEELMHNDNVAFKDELGRTKRSTHQAGKVGTGTLGALICETLPQAISQPGVGGAAARFTQGGIRFNIGTGFTAAQRAEWFWGDPVRAAQELCGRIVKYKHFAAAGVVDAPRFPVFLGFRDERDLG